MSNLLDEIKASGLDDILAIRQNIGVDLAKVYLIIRTWAGIQVGEGEYTDEITEVLPTPGIKDYSHHLRVTEAGSIRQGDLLIRMISKNGYSKDQVNCQTDQQHVEKFFRVGDSDCTVVTVVEKHLTWDVQVRPRSDQSRGA